MTFPNTTFVSRVTVITKTWIQAVNDYIVGLISSTGSDNVGTPNPLSPAYLKTLSDIANGDQVSLFRFVPTAETAAIQARTSTYDVSADVNTAITALTAASNSGGLYVPRGTFLHNTGNVYGNTAATCDAAIVIRGEGRLSAFLTTAPGVIPITIQGPHPDIDRAGNRYTGRSVIERVAFLGPGTVGAKSGSGLKWYGAQGITARTIYVSGWDEGIFMQNTDIQHLDDLWLIGNNYGLNSNESGYAAGGGGQMNSFKMFGGQIGNNTIAGVRYIGGIAPTFESVNFTVNGSSLIISPTHAANNPVTQSLYVHNCYFENDTSNTIILGGGTGVVRDPIIDGGSIIANAAVPAILVANAANTGVGQRGYINIAMTLSDGATAIDQSTSAGKIDFGTINARDIGTTTPAQGVFTKVNSGQFTKAGVAAGASVDICNMSGPGDTTGLTLTVHSTSSGIVTAKTYSVVLMGAGNAGAGAMTAITEDYSGGPSAFTLSEVANSPGFGTNKLVLTNDSAATCTFTVAYTIEFNNGVFTLL